MNITKVSKFILRRLSKKEHTKFILHLYQGITFAKVSKNLAKYENNFVEL